MDGALPRRCDEHETYPVQSLGFYHAGHYVGLRPSVATRRAAPMPEMAVEAAREHQPGAAARARARVDDFHRGARRSVWRVCVVARRLLDTEIDGGVRGVAASERGDRRIVRGQH